MLEIRRSPTGIQVFVEGGVSFPLPNPVELKSMVLEAAIAYEGPDSDVCTLIQDCDFDYEVVPGKDAIEKVIALVVTTSPANAAVLYEEEHPIQPDFWGAVMEACPEIGDGRIVEREA